MTELIIVGLVGVVAGGVAAVAGFGIGSLLTPVLAPILGVRLAVAAISIPHAVGTAIRLWRLRDAIDRDVLRGFGIASAAGGLLGALLQGLLVNPQLATLFGLLLILSGLASLTGWARRVRLRGGLATLAGGLSGMFGGLVGNQGGIRTAALLAFPLSPRAFVATATATALVVDAARMPVYLVTAGWEMLGEIPLIAAATAGVAVGTLFGGRLLEQLPETVFRTTVGLLLLLVGAAFLVGVS